ncbi:MAG: Hpt domain-containing protein [Desulfobacterales bacterium]|nr:Hpt domain-containing protein [Desulfobacterales bacterium]
MEDKNGFLDGVFDKKDFFDRLEGDSELGRQLGEMFLDDADEKMGQLRDALEKNNLDEVLGAAHSLKGASANMSALRLRRIAADLEQAARKHEKQHAAEIFALLETEMEKFVSELKRYVLD